MLGSEEAIADAKAEIFEGLEPGGTAILNADNPWTGELAKTAKGRGGSVRDAMTAITPLDDRLRAVLDAQLGEDALEVFFHRGELDAEDGADRRGAQRRGVSRHATLRRR